MVTVTIAMTDTEQGHEVNSELNLIKYKKFNKIIMDV